MDDAHGMPITMALLAQLNIVGVVSVWFVTDEFV
jgi:hypothetical protein